MKSTGPIYPKCTISLYVFNNQGEPPEVIDNTQETPSTITNPSRITSDENGKKTESHFSPNFDISQNLFNIFMTTHLLHKSYCKMTLQILLRLHMVMLLKLQLVHSHKQTSHCCHQHSRTSCSLKSSYKMVMIQMLVLIIMLPQTSKNPRKLMKLITTGWG